MADPTSFDMAPKPTYRINWDVIGLFVATYGLTGLIVWALWLCFR